MPSPVLFTAAAGGTLLAQILTVIIAFSVVVYILYYFAWGPIIRLLDERRETIAREFDTIEQKQATLEGQIKDYEERLRHIDAEARERTNKAIEEGRKAATALLEEARQQAEQIRRKGQTDIQLEIEKARAVLRDDMVRMTISATEKLLREKLDDEQHRRLVENYLGELEQREAS